MGDRISEGPRLSADNYSPFQFCQKSTGRNISDLPTNRDLGLRIEMRCHIRMRFMVTGLGWGTSRLVALLLLSFHAVWVVVGPFRRIHGTSNLGAFGYSHFLNFLRGRVTRTIHRPPNNRIARVGRTILRSCVNFHVLVHREAAKTGSAVYHRSCRHLKSLESFATFCGYRRRNPNVLKNVAIRRVFGIDNPQTIFLACRLSIRREVDRGYRVQTAVIQGRNISM